MNLLEIAVIFCLLRDPVVERKSMSDVKADSTFPSMQIDPEAIDHCPLRGDSCDTPAKVQQSDYAGSFLCKLKDFLHEIYSAYEFPIHIVLSMVLAKLYPPLGAVYLAPQITASVIAVCLIFVIVGLGLKTKELSNALQRLKFNLFIQVFNFCFVSGCVFVATRLLTSIHVLNDALADGMVICSCLPIAINALIVLTASTGGDEAVAVFNTCFSNLLGIFVSPILILFYLGKSEAVDVKDIFVNLAFIVILPMFSGWLLQNYVPPARCLYATHKRRFKRMQESCLVFIIYTVFCRKFLSASSGLNAGESPAGITDVFIMIGLEFVLIAFFMNVAWAVLDIVFPDEPELRVTGLFACHHKTSE